MTDPRIEPLAPAAAAPAARALLDRARKEMGMLPNLYRVLAHSPAALAGYDGFARGLEQGRLPKRMREQIALFVAAANDCEYCLAAHRVTGRMAKLSAVEIAAAERGEATDAAERAGLRLAADILKRRGDVDDDSMAEARAAGLAHEAVVEIAAHVALNLFTNTVNRLARTPVDFGRVARVAAEIVARFGKN